jgi:5-methyltetrahydropteroyltriglutamate--homocysteine methyltransferase
MLETTLAGSLPKPEWLAETKKLWPQWRAQGEALAAAKRDATLLWLKAQEDAGLDIVSDGEQSRQHFVHGFLEAVEGIDFEHKVKMGIRANRYEAMVPVVAGPLRLKGRAHPEARFARAHTSRKLKFTLPGPMTIVDTVADRHYGDKVKLAMAFAELLNEEARALEKDGVDVIQFDEPAFNVYMDDVKKWGIAALERAARGLKCLTCVHICYGYGIQANIDWKRTLGAQWRQYEAIFPALAKSRIRQVSLECANSKVPIELLGLLKGKDVLVGVIDVANDLVETPAQVASTIGRALRYVPAGRVFPCTNCGMAPMDREVALAKLRALAAGAALARRRYGKDLLAVGWGSGRLARKRPRRRRRPVSGSRGSRQTSRTSAGSAGRRTWASGVSCRPAGRGAETALPPALSMSAPAATERFEFAATAPRVPRSAGGKCSSRWEERGRRGGSCRG